MSWSASAVLDARSFITLPNSHGTVVSSAPVKSAMSSASTVEHGHLNYHNPVRWPCLMSLAELRSDPCVLDLSAVDIAVFSMSIGLSLLVFLESAGRLSL